VAAEHAAPPANTPVIIQRLQATRLRLLDLYATPAQAGQP